jgi:hypothetical protein
VSKFHTFWCLVAQESKLGKKVLFFCTITVNSSVFTVQVWSYYRISLVPLLNKSGRADLPD